MAVRRKGTALLTAILIMTIAVSTTLIAARVLLGNSRSLARSANSHAADDLAMSALEEGEARLAAGSLPYGQEYPAGSPLDTNYQYTPPLPLARGSQPASGCAQPVGDGWLPGALTAPPTSIPTISLDADCPYSTLQIRRLAYVAYADPSATGLNADHKDYLFDKGVVEYGKDVTINLYTEFDSAGNPNGNQAPITFYVNQAQAESPFTIKLCWQKYDGVNPLPASSCTAAKGPLSQFVVDDTLPSADTSNALNGTGHTMVKSVIINVPNDPTIYFRPVLRARKDRGTGQPAIIDTGETVVDAAGFVGGTVKRKQLTYYQGNPTPVLKDAAAPIDPEGWRL